MLIPWVVFRVEGGRISPAPSLVHHKKAEPHDTDRCGCIHQKCIPSHNQDSSIAFLDLFYLPVVALPSLFLPYAEDS